MFAGRGLDTKMKYVAMYLYLHAWRLHHYKPHQPDGHNAFFINLLKKNIFAQPDIRIELKCPWKNPVIFKQNAHKKKKKNIADCHFPEPNLKTSRMTPN